MIDVKQGHMPLVIVANIIYIEGMLILSIW